MKIYIGLVVISTLLATVVGAGVSGAVGGLTGLAIFGLIGGTGYLIAASVTAAEATRLKHK